MKKVLKIATLNCYGAPISFNRTQRFKRIAEEIEKLDPDILFLQEVFFESDRKILANYLLRSGWKIFPKTYSKFGPGGLLTFIKNLKVEQIEFFRFSNQGPIGILSSADRIAGKGFQSLQVRVKNKNLLLINAHLLCVYNQKPKYKNAFNSQFAQLTSYIEENKTKKIVLAGDLNLLSDNQKLLNFVKKFNLKDSFDKNQHTVVPQNTNRRGFVKPFVSQTPFRCDYILTGKNARTQNSKILFDSRYLINGKQKHLSDHFGLSLEVVI